MDNLIYTKEVKEGAKTTPPPTRTHLKATQDDALTAINTLSNLIGNLPKDQFGLNREVTADYNIIMSKIKELLPLI